MPRSNRLSLSLASTAAEALATQPLGITPASVAKVSEGTTSSIGVIEASSNAQQLNIGNLGVQGSSTVLVAREGKPEIVVGTGRSLRGLLWQLFQKLGLPVAASDWYFPTSNSN